MHCFQRLVPMSALILFVGLFFPERQSNAQDKESSSATENAAVIHSPSITPC